MKNGFKVMDSDLHTMEPDGLWEKYLEDPFKAFAPKFLRGTEAAPNQPVIKIGDLDIGEMSYVATDADEKPLRQVIEAIGDDNIVVSTDYPHSDGLFPKAIEGFVHLEGVSDKSKAKILWDNCARFYNLTASK